MTRGMPITMPNADTRNFISKNEAFCRGKCQQSYLDRPRLPLHDLPPSRPTLTLIDKLNQSRGRA
jgi:hypothetical protein